MSIFLLILSKNKLQKIISSIPGLLYARGRTNTQAREREWAHFLQIFVHNISSNVECKKCKDHFVTKELCLIGGFLERPYKLLPLHVLMPLMIQHVKIHTAQPKRRVSNRQVHPHQPQNLHQLIQFTGIPILDITFVPHITTCKNILLTG